MLWTPPSSLLRPSRRQLLATGLAAGAAGLVTPRTARASVSASDRKFIFVFACGGWDPTRVMADGFDYDIVDMEANAERATAGGLTYVNSPTRPSVQTFFDRYASQTAMIQGLLVPSIAHEACFILSLTGSSADTGSDWPAILGAASLDRYVAPTLVLGGPTFPGVNLPAVVQTGGSGQLSDLINGDFTTWSPAVGRTLGLPAQQKIDAFVRNRAGGYEKSARSDAMKAKASAFAMAADQAGGLKAQRHQLHFSDITTLGDAFDITADALSLGLSRCVMVCHPVSGERGYDSHTTNDDLQNVMFEDLFSNLLTLFFLLETSPGTSAPTLAEETTVVVFSEMGRTPWLNEAGGKDHWPYTSAMLVGSGVRGGINIGAFDQSWYGVSIDPETGAEDANGVPVGCAAFGATLLALGDVDPAPYTGDVEPIPVLMA